VLRSAELRLLGQVGSHAVVPCSYTRLQMAAPGALLPTCRVQRALSVMSSWTVRLLEAWTCSAHGGNTALSKHRSHYAAWP
jgi:hypothetical protein